jgi:Sugar diacid utilization regulator
MSSPSQSSASVRNILTLLASRDAQLVAGGGGLERRVTWACRMRARLPAFESVQGGELALLTLSRLSQLNETLPHLLKVLHQAGVSVVGVAAPSVQALGQEAIDFADQMNLPLLLLPNNALLEEVMREVITFVVSFRGETERKATEIANQLMQLSLQGAGIQGVCEHLASHRGKWVVIQDADQQVRFQVAPTHSSSLHLPSPLSDEQLRMQGLVRVVEPIPSSRHEIVGYLSLIGNESDFDYLERIVLHQVTPIVAIEFARERDRSEVENRYQVEAFTDVLQGHYQQPDEMMARAHLLGYDLTTPQIVAIFEISLAERDFPSSNNAQWGKRIRDELVREWPGSWILVETRRVTAILPLPAFDESPEAEREYENTWYTRLERVISRISAYRNNGARSPQYSCGLGRIASSLESIPQAHREAQQALEIGRRLFGEGNLHSFSRLGIYRLLFHLSDHSELDDFYQETLEPLLSHDTTYIETLEGFFRCNGNLSEMARTMHFHRNSLLYRLNRIESLLGHSLEDPELRLSLQIALKIYHLKNH